MHHVAIDDLSPNPHANADRRDLTDPLETAGLAINRFVLEPGEWCSSLHAHEDQEEVFVVLSGTLTVETLDGETTVDADEAVRFAPGEYHAGRNGDGSGDDRAGGSDDDRAGGSDDRSGGSEDAGSDDGDGDVELLALGAPRDSEAIRIPLTCPDCRERGLRPAMADEGPVLVCPDCGGETDATCPDCGSPEMVATIPEGRSEPVGVCQECGAVDEN